MLLIIDNYDSFTDNPAQSWPGIVRLARETAKSTFALAQADGCKEEMPCIQN